MRGVSEVIAIILILMITISLAGLAYLFMSTTMADVTSSAGSSVDTTTSSILTSLTIESISQNHVYVRNTGSNPLTGLSVYVSDETVNASVPESIAPGEVGIVNITHVIFEGDAIKVTSTNGVSASKRAPAEYYGAEGYWKLDESEGLYAYDSSPNSNTGNLTNGPVWTAGKFGSALQFDGLDDYIQNANFLNNELYLNGLTVSFWTYMNINSNNFPLGKARNCEGSAEGSNYGWHFKVYPNRIIFETCRGDQYAFNQAYYYFPSNYTWYHVVGVHDTISSRILIYVDGILRANNSLGSPSQLNYTGNFRIGADNAGGHFNGTIDEVAIWNRALSTSEISKLYTKAVY